VSDRFGTCTACGKSTNTGEHGFGVCYMKGDLSDHPKGFFGPKPTPMTTLKTEDGVSMHCNHCEQGVCKVHGDVVTNDKGGKQSHVDARYDLFPPAAWDVVAKVLGEGAKKYKEWNWLLIESQSHLNHALNHIAKFQEIQSCQECEEQQKQHGKGGRCYKHIQPEYTEDHAAHAACRIMMWMEMLVREGRRP
jgi:hypothetical protein